MTCGTAVHQFAQPPPLRIARMQTQLPKSQKPGNRPLTNRGHPAIIGNRNSKGAVGSMAYSANFLTFVYK